MVLIILSPRACRNRALPPIGRVADAPIAGKSQVLDSGASQPEIGCSARPARLTQIGRGSTPIASRARRIAEPERPAASAAPLVGAGGGEGDSGMSEIGGAAILLVILLAGSALGVFVRPFLPEHHRTRETTELIQLVVTMLVTFAALVLGLLTSTVKASYDTVDNDLRSFAIQLIQLDRSLRQYGSEAEPARALLRSYTAAAIASTWTQEPKPPGDYYPKVAPPESANSIESIALGDMLTRLEVELRRLSPPDPKDRRLAIVSLDQFERLARMRWKLIEEAHSSISVPFYAVLAFWLVIVFASFGLSAPRNAFSYVTILLAALSIGSVIYVMLDLDTPFTGLFMVSSQPMRDALAQLSR